MDLIFFHLSFNILNDQLVNTWMFSPNTLEGIFLATNWHDVGHEWGMTCSFQITTSPKFGISSSDLGFLITDSDTTESRCLCCFSPTQLLQSASKLLIFWDANALPKFNLEPKNDGCPKGINLPFGAIFRWSMLNFGRVHPLLCLIPGFNYPRRTWKTCFLERPSAPAM